MNAKVSMNNALDDFELQCEYTAVKSQIQQTHLAYIQEHPEIKDFLSDYMQILIHQKPDNVYEFTRDYFDSSFGKPQEKAPCYSADYCETADAESKMTVASVVKDRAERVDNAAIQSIVSTAPIEESAPVDKSVDSTSIEESAPVDKSVDSTSIEESAPVDKSVDSTSIEESAPVDKSVDSTSIEESAPVDKSVDSTSIEESAPVDKSVDST
jgi:hypothetical protein